MKKFILIVSSILLVHISFAQKRYFTKTGIVSFEAGTAVEDIDAINKSVTSIFDATSGQYEFALLVNGFEFKRSLMQQHFNEDYLESDKYPKSTFKGKITNIDQVNFKKDGTYPVTVKGILEMHGVKKEIETPGVFKVKGDDVSSTATFTILLEDYQIAIPSLVKDKISKTVKISVNCSYSILK
ncbi:MAG: YceI family protein [Bacteroidota bacterium]|nr:YceI family protein [Bacteroidota bacterium]